MDHLSGRALAAAAVVSSVCLFAACASPRKDPRPSIPTVSSPKPGAVASAPAGDITPAGDTTPAKDTPPAKDTTPANDTPTDAASANPLAGPAASDTTKVHEGAKTPDEQRDRLDRDLDASLAAFDAMLLKEQQEVAAKRAEQGTGVGGGGEGGAGEGSASSGAGATSGGSQTSTAATRADGRRRGSEGSGRRTKDQATGSSQGGDRDAGEREVTTAPEGAATKTGDASRVPPDVGDGRNDDVVARQLREAAMKEEDPAIREKLWDEYRRYKRGGS